MFTFRCPWKQGLWLFWCLMLTPHYCLVKGNCKQLYTFQTSTRGIVRYLAERRPLVLLLVLGWRRLVVCTEGGWWLELVEGSECHLTPPPHSHATVLVTGQQHVRVLRLTLSQTTSVHRPQLQTHSYYQVTTSLLLSAIRNTYYNFYFSTWIIVFDLGPSYFKFSSKQCNLHLKFLFAHWKFCGIKKALTSNNSISAPIS